MPSQVLIRSGEPDWRRFNLGQAAFVPRIGVSHEVDGRHRIAIVPDTSPPT